MRPASGLDQADDHVEAGGLSGAVGAEQPDDLSLGDVEAYAAHYLASFVGLADFVGRQSLHLLRRPGVGDRL
jgi:hypothetical protein